MRLLSITFKATPRMPGVRASELSTIKTDAPGDALKGWRVSIRGQQVFFISPPGWTRDQNAKARDHSGAVTVFEVPRPEVYFEWQGASDEIEGVLKGGKFDSEPFGPPPRARATTPLTVPAHQMGD